MTAHRSPTKSRRPLSSVPAGQPPGMRLSRRCRLSEAPNTIEGYGQPSSAITGQKKTLTFGPQGPENQHCPRQPLLISEQHRSSRPKYRQKSALPSSAITELRTTPISKAHVPQEHASPSSAITELRKTPIFKHKIPQEPAVNPRQPLLDSGTHSAPSPRCKKSQQHPSSAITGVGCVLVERPRYHQRQRRALVGHYRLGQVFTPRIPRNQQLPFVSHYWRQVYADREAKIRGDSRPTFCRRLPLQARACVLTENLPSPRYQKTQEPT